MENEEQEKENLAKLAAAYGFQSSYFDIWGESHKIPLETLKELLAAAGVEVSNSEKGLKHLEHRSWAELAPPVLVESIERLPVDFPFQLSRVHPPEQNPDPALQVWLEIL